MITDKNKDQPLERLDNFEFSWQRNGNLSDVLVEKTVKCVTFCLKQSKSWSISNWILFICVGRFKHLNNLTISCRSNLVHSFCENVVFSAAIQKLLTETVVWTQDVKTRSQQKQLLWSTNWQSKKVKTKTIWRSGITSLSWTCSWLFPVSTSQRFWWTILAFWFGHLACNVIFSILKIGKNQLAFFYLNTDKTFRRPKPRK